MDRELGDVDARAEAVASRVNVKGFDVAMGVGVRLAGAEAHPDTLAEGVLVGSGDTDAEGSADGDASVVPDATGDCDSEPEAERDCDWVCVPDEDGLCDGDGENDGDGDVDGGSVGEGELRALDEGDTV